jgi:iron complex outermembrane receptor protein
MKINCISQVIVISLTLPSLSAFAENVEIITIEAPKLTYSSSAFAEGNLVMPDVADWLKTVPGADINKNGPITGIAQYRGMFGDRVAKSISGHQIVSAGPNAMDAPLTYINPIMVESVSLYRGIAPVSSGIDTIGGAVKVELKRAQLDGDFEVGGDLALNYNDINQATTIAGDLRITNNNFAALVYLSEQKSDDYKDADGHRVKSTQYDKQQYGLDLRYGDDAWNIGTTWHHASTQNSGTPALPMDIDFIESDRYNLDGQLYLNNWQINWQLGYQDATHGMDNFKQRKNMMMDMYRVNTADATTFDYKIIMNQGDWLWGFEGFDADHNSLITNPNATMFKIDNFKNVKDARHSFVAQWSTNTGVHSHTLGVRIKQNYADADNVIHSMSMMNPNIMALQNEFNQQDKNISDTTNFISINNRYQWSDSTLINYGVGIKQRAASYQERYLWVPMQATGGLADGKTYVGNINLEAETAYQIDLGISYERNGFSIAPHIFYQKIHDYIQGTPSMDMRVKMIAGMMNDTSPLVFTNIDAKLYGADVNWQFPINQHFKLSGIASYVRGTREDNNDDLYRIMPLNTRFNLHYQQGTWQSNLAIHFYHKQSHVSQLNNEKASKGYMVIDWQCDYFISKGGVARLGVNNLLNKQYNDHLNGINRAAGSDIAVGSKMPAMGRNVYLAIDYQF